MTLSPENFQASRIFPIRFNVNVEASHGFEHNAQQALRHRPKTGCSIRSDHFPGKIFSAGFGNPELRKERR